MSDADSQAFVEATQLAEKAQAPAVSGNIWVGTAGWTDPTLVKSKLFYPAGTTTPRARLHYYASQFRMVEVDATYYTLISEETTERWCQATPDGFTFNIKAHPILTGHPIDVSRLPKDLKQELLALGHEQRVLADRLPHELALEMERRFFAPLEVLQRSGKLGSVLLQFPPWFTATKGNARRIVATRQRYPSVPFAVEFRHQSWLNPTRVERVLAMLSEQQMSYVCVDEPPGKVGGLPALARTTNPELAVVRFHGRNRAGWAKRGASVHERFNYLYSQAELSSWVEPVRRLAGEAERVHAVFNNCVQNYAVLNAKGLVVLLGV